MEGTDHCGFFFLFRSASILETSAGLVDTFSRTCKITKISMTPKGLTQLIITKYGSTQYIGMTQVVLHYAHTFEIFMFHFLIQLLTHQTNLYHHKEHVSKKQLKSHNRYFNSKKNHFSIFFFFFFFLLLLFSLEKCISKSGKIWI